MWWLIVLGVDLLAVCWLFCYFEVAFPRFNERYRKTEGDLEEDFEGSFEVIRDKSIVVRVVLSREYPRVAS